MRKTKSFQNRGRVAVRSEESETKVRLNGQERNTRLMFDDGSQNALGAHILESFGLATGGEPPSHVCAGPAKLAGKGQG